MNLLLIFVLSDCGAILVFTYYDCYISHSSGHCQKELTPVRASLTPISFKVNVLCFLMCLFLNAMK